MDESPERLTVRWRTDQAMGATQSNDRRYMWIGDTKTYTFPRSGVHRSVSISADPNVLYCTSIGHPDAPDPECRLLKVNPRLSRSYSLDAVCPFSPLTMHNVAVVDAVHMSPKINSTHIKTTKYPLTGGSQCEDNCFISDMIVSASTHSGIIKKTEDPTLVNDQQGLLVNKWSDPESCSVGPHFSNLTVPFGMFPFIPEDIRRGMCESWAWADQDDACSLTDRPCDSLDCTHCRENINNQQPAIDCSQVKLQYNLDESMSNDQMKPKEERRRHELRNKPTAAGSVYQEPVDSRCQTHTVEGSWLNVPPPMFTASSWETLPPADELEVELEEKTITDALLLRLVPLTPPNIQSPTSTPPFNLSHMNLDHNRSECDSWASFAITDSIRRINMSFLPGFTPFPVPLSPFLSPSNKSVPINQETVIVKPQPPIIGPFHVAPPSSHGTSGEIVLSVNISQNKSCNPAPSVVSCERMKIKKDTNVANKIDTCDKAVIPMFPSLKQLRVNNPSTCVKEKPFTQPHRHLPKIRQRSFSLDENGLLSRTRQRHRHGQIQSLPADPPNDFLFEIESRIPGKGLQETSPPLSVPFTSLLSKPAFTPSIHNGPSLPTLLLEAFTQTSPAPSTSSSSSASSDACLSYFGCPDHTSLEPCHSSLALTVSEDDYGNDDNGDDIWSRDGSVSSSSQLHISASLPHDDSSLSLSESLDILDVNGESGIGTVSTRPSVSPRQIQTFDFSAPNLYSEDTGLENSFERKFSNYIPSFNSRDQTYGEVYMRYPRSCASEQWVKRENQITQTDPEPLILHANPLDDSCDRSDGICRGRDINEVCMMRHTHSEPQLDTSLTPLDDLLRDVCSEAILSPIPLNYLRESFTPSVLLPTLTEDKPPIPANSRKSRPRNISISSPYNLYNTTLSAPSLKTHLLPTPSTPATAVSKDLPEAPHQMLFPRAQSSKELAELEALEACKWLRAAGFPQYAQMYDELHFPLDLVSVQRDHSFLERDSLQALFRRLSALNRCAKIKLNSASNNKSDESDDDEVAISDNWSYQRPSRRWSRVVQEKGLRSGITAQLSDLEVPDDALLVQFKRAGSERLKDGAKAFLRRMESIKNKKKKLNREGLVISSPKLLDEAVMREKVGHLSCINLLSDVSTSNIATTIATTSMPSAIFSNIIPSITTNTVTNTTDLMRKDYSNYSQDSTPLYCSRGSRRLPRRKSYAVGEPGGNSGAHSDSEFSTQTWRPNYLSGSNSYNMAAVTTSPSAKHHRGGRGSGPTKTGQVRYSGSLNYGKDSHTARENFLANTRGGGMVYKASSEDQVIPPPSLSEDRHSVYDNVPLIICNKVYDDYQPEAVDSGSGSSGSRDSPLHFSHDEEDNDDFISRGRATVERWHSFNRRSYQPVVRQLSTQINSFSSGQMLHLRKRALLRLTALMERYCPSNRSGWTWELPKFMRKMKTPDYRERQVFGVPLQVVAQRTGQPLPSGIQTALKYLRATSLDQVGIFRKPGVRSRIQKLRELHENGVDVFYSSFSAYDIADMVKTYFRELPEVLLTNKLSEMFIAIFQYLPNEHRLEALQCAVLMLPDENREVLMTLLTFLADVAASAHLNQMTASNLAVCLAPSLFHLNVGGSSGSSPLRRRPANAPEQKDLHENKAAHQCLTLMILEVSRLQCVPIEMLSNCRFTYLEQSQPVSLEDLGMGSPGGITSEGDWNSYMNACITSLFKEARDKSRGWISVSCDDSEVEVMYRKVGDGHPLRLWRTTTEVEAPPAELLTRVIRERHLWDDSLFKWRVVTRLDRQSDIFQYMCNFMPPRPSVDYCVLRHWLNDLARGSCVLVETSVEHEDAPVLVGGVRGIVLASRYLIQPCGSGKSRITHISRVDMRGRTPEWYNKIYGHVTATHLKQIRQSFQHHAIGPESKV